MATFLWAVPCLCELDTVYLYLTAFSTTFFSDLVHLFLKAHLTSCSKECHRLYILCGGKELFSCFLCFNMHFFFLLCLLVLVSGEVTRSYHSWWDIVKRARRVGFDFPFWHALESSIFSSIQPKAELCKTYSSIATVHVTHWVLGQPFSETLSSINYLTISPLPQRLIISTFLKNEKNPQGRESILTANQGQEFSQRWGSFALFWEQVSSKLLQHLYYGGHKLCARGEASSTPKHSMHFCCLPGSCE